MRRTPGCALAVVAVAALGVGATTAAFWVTDHVLIRPLPFPEPDRLVELWRSNTRAGLQPRGAQPGQLSPQLRSFKAMGAFYKGSVNLVGTGDPVRLQSSNVTAEVLPVVGTRPLLGQTSRPRKTARVLRERSC